MYHFIVKEGDEIVSYGQVNGKKQLAKKKELVEKICGRKLVLVKYLEWKEWKKKIDDADNDNMRKYFAIRRDLKCVSMNWHQRHIRMCMVRN